MPSACCVLGGEGKEKGGANRATGERDLPPTDAHHACTMPVPMSYTLCQQIVTPPPCRHCSPYGHVTPQAPEGSVVASPASLRDVWLLRMAREAPTKAYLLLRWAERAIQAAMGCAADIGLFVAQPRPCLRRRRLACVQWYRACVQCSAGCSAAQWNWCTALGCNFRDCKRNAHVLLLLSCVMPDSSTAHLHHPQVGWL